MTDQKHEEKNDRVTGMEALERFIVKKGPNLAGKLIGGFIFYQIGKACGGDYGSIVGAYVGLRANYKFHGIVPVEINWD
jgi:hypothetical protein